MLFGFFGSLLNSTVAYAYPAYASFKTLSRRPASEPELERWLMYWSVVGCVVALEYTAEWTISWIPFYWFLKTVFLLWLALPQTQGATYMYQAHLAPLLTTYEPTIDAHINEYKSRFYGFFHEKFQVIWTQISALIAQHTGINLNAVADPAGPQDGQNQGASAQAIMNLWRTWGPVVTTALRPPADPQAAEPAPRRRQPSASNAPPSRPSASTTSSSQSNIDTIRARRRQIEAELARLAALEQQHGTSSPDLVNVPSSSNLDRSVYLSEPGSATPSEASLETNARGIRDSGRYEEISAEDIDDDESDVGSPTRPAPNQRWSFWGKGSSGYTPLKNE